MTTPSRLDRHGRRRPAHAGPCPDVLVLDDKTSAPCEGVEGHEGPHVARVTVTWERDTLGPATGRNGASHA